MLPPMNTCCDASLTVLVSVHNAEATIAGEIETLLDSAADRGRRFELLVVDDASTDHTWEIVCELRTRYPQIRGMRNSHAQGLSRSLEIARRAARGTLAIGKQGRIVAVDAPLVADESLPIPAVPRPLGQQRLQRLANWANEVAEVEELWQSPFANVPKPAKTDSSGAAPVKPNVLQPASAGSARPQAGQPLANATSGSEALGIDPPRLPRRSQANFLDHLRTMSFGPRSF